MASVLLFRPSDRPSVRPADQQRDDAEIVIFPGVRYERRLTGSSCQTAEAAGGPSKRPLTAE